MPAGLRCRKYTLNKLLIQCVLCVSMVASRVHQLTDKLSLNGPGNIKPLTCRSADVKFPNARGAPEYFNGVSIDSTARDDFDFRRGSMFVDNEASTSLFKL